MRSTSGEEVQELKRQATTKILTDSDGRVKFSIEGTDLTYYPREICAEVLAKMTMQAKEQHGSLIRKAIVTIPANFDKVQKDAWQKLVDLSGLQCDMMLVEPCAAALNHIH